MKLLFHCQSPWFQIFYLNNKFFVRSCHLDAKQTNGTSYIALETTQHLLWLVRDVLSLCYDDQFLGWLLASVDMLLRVITHFPQNHVWNFMQTTHVLSTMRPNKSKKFPSCTNNGRHMKCPYGRHMKSPYGCHMKRPCRRHMTCP